MDDTDSEFDQAAEDLNLNSEQAEGVQAEPEQDAAAIEDAERQQRIEGATAMIKTGLNFGLSAFGGVSVDDGLCEQTSRAYAELIEKHFPGGIFGLADKYKEEITAATCTVMLVGAVNNAKAAQAEAEAKRAAEEAAKKNQDDTNTVNANIKAV